MAFNTSVIPSTVDSAIPHKYTREIIKDLFMELESVKKGLVKLHLNAGPSTFINLGSWAPNVAGASPMQDSTCNNTDTNSFTHKGKQLVTKVKNVLGKVCKEEVYNSLLNQGMELQPVSDRQIDSQVLSYLIESFKGMTDEAIEKTIWSAKIGMTNGQPIPAPVPYYSVGYNGFYELAAADADTIKVSTTSAIDPSTPSNIVTALSSLYRSIQGNYILTKNKSKMKLIVSPSLYLWIEDAVNSNAFNANFNKSDNNDVIKFNGIEILSVSLPEWSYFNELNDDPASVAHRTTTAMFYIPDMCVLGTNLGSDYANVSTLDLQKFDLGNKNYQFSADYAIGTQIGYGKYIAVARFGPADFGFARQEAIAAGTGVDPNYSL